MDKTLIFGHKKPDTDTVTSAIAYSYLKNKLGFLTEPCLLGELNNETKLMVLVVGETARAENFSLNGYAKNTNPKLAKQDLINFSLSLNSPNNQIKMMQLEEVMKTLAAYNAAVTPPDHTVFPAMSHVRAMKEILGYSEDEIMQNLEEMRIERAAVVELNKTEQIIKKTGLFDKVDKLYGEPGATYTDESDGEFSSKGGGGGSMVDFGGDSEIPDEIGNEDKGSETETSTEETSTEESTKSPSLESVFMKHINKPVLLEKKEETFFNNMINKLKSHEQTSNGIKIITENFKFNENFDNMFNDLKDKKENNKD
jgi:hypothetical protein